MLCARNIIGKLHELLVVNFGINMLPWMLRENNQLVINKTKLLWDMEKHF